MSSIAYHRKKNGVTYVYSVESYWDKEKKAPRNKQVCLGKLDPETGKLILSKRKSKATAQEALKEGVAATARVAGPYLLLSGLAKETGLESCVKRTFPALHNEIMSLVHFIVHKGLPLSRSESWSQGHLHPANAPLSSQRISELLLQIAEDDRQKFLSLWLKQMTAKDCLFYDITSISSYATANAYLRYGYNRDGEALHQINFALIFGQERGLPAYYRRLPGNISDTSTLQTTMKAMDFLGTKALRFVLDRGFYSQKNVDALFSKHHHFTMAVPAGRKWVLETLDRHYDAITSPANYHQIDNGEALYMTTESVRWGEAKKRAYLHIYYNAARAAEDYDRFTRKLLQLKQKIELQPLDKLDPDDARFFIITNTPKRGLKVAFNEPEIQKYRKRYAGFFCILSTHLKNPRETLDVYKRRDAVENSFDDLKNQLDMKRLRVHTPAAMDSRIFLQFLALILMSGIRKTAKNTETIKNMTVREIMESMETLVQIKYEKRYGSLYTETSPLQRKIIEAFSIRDLS